MSPLFNKGYIESPRTYSAPSQGGKSGICKWLTGICRVALLNSATNPAVASSSYSETLLGYSVSASENFETQFAAFRMAVETAGCKPYEIVTDNQGGQRSKVAQKFFANICRVNRPTAPYNGPSKSIESVFGRFQKQVLHADWRFTGGNISSKEAWKINREFFVRFDPQTMDRALLYTKTPMGLRYETVAYPYLSIRRNIQEQQPGDMDLIRLNDEANKRERVRRQIEAHALEIEHGVAPEQHGLRTPALRGISEREYERLADAVVVVPAEPEVEPIAVGEYTKAVSNMDIDPLAIFNRM